MTLLLFFEVKAVIEEHYERRIEFYRYVNPPLSREAERELGEWKGKVRDITATVLHHLFPVRDVCRCGSAYPERFFLSGLQVVKVGINFDVEKHTLGDWVIEE
mgnify:CR=1 FL=1